MRLTFKEIKDFIKVGKNTERKFNKNQIKDLTSALAINSGEQKCKRYVRVPWVSASPVC